jgi:hypothetical protein
LKHDAQEAAAFDDLGAEPGAIDAGRHILGMVRV